MTPHWCYGTCGYQLLQAAAMSAADIGTATLQVELLSGPPLIMTPYWRDYKCRHGNVYWLAPTRAQVDQWEEGGTP